MQLAEWSYEAYGQSVFFKNLDGHPMLEFNRLPKSYQDAWVAAVQEAVMTHNRIVSQDLASKLLADLPEPGGT
jgi:hypothetical protein